MFSGEVGYLSLTNGRLLDREAWLWRTIPSRCHSWSVLLSVGVGVARPESVQGRVLPFSGRTLAAVPSLGWRYGCGWSLPVVRIPICRKDPGLVRIRFVCTRELPAHPNEAGGHAG